MELVGEDRYLSIVVLTKTKGRRYGFSLCEKKKKLPSVSLWPKKRIPISPITRQTNTEQRNSNSFNQVPLFMLEYSIFRCNIPVTLDFPSSFFGPGFPFVSNFGDIILNFLKAE